MRLLYNEIAMKILIVDDEEPIRELIKYNVEKQKYETFTAENGQQALELCRNKNPDLVILDLMLPDMSGLDICRIIRNDSSIKNIPIIMVTAKTEDSDIVTGLELGADDYVTKPFSVRELMARVKANLRKNEITNVTNITPEQIPEIIETETKKDNIIKVNDIELDLDRFEVKVRGDIIDLTLREFEVLKFLAAQPGQVITRETLLEKVWGYEYYGDIRTVDVTVRRIREIIEKDTSSPKILITKRGVGYYIATK